MEFPELKKLLRSGLLPSLRDFFALVESQLGTAAGHERYEMLRVRQLQLVVDANVLIADVGYLAARRNQKELRTRLQELIASQTVVAFAPPSVSREVSRNLAGLARQKRLPKSRLVAVWREYKKLIVFRAPAPVESAGLDRL